MKPTNHDSTPCNPQSSNCVIWSGPDLKCINLCKGDSITKVMEKMALEICAILESLNVENYDLECFGIQNCAPQNFQELLQFLINQICENEDHEHPMNAPVDPCDALNCEVEVADCFADDCDDTLPLGEYIALIAERLCALILGTGNNNQAIQNQQVEINNIKGDIERISEENPIPTITPVCVLGPKATATQIDIVLSALEVQFCELRDTTGLPNEILAAIARQCSNLDLLAGTGALDRLDEWSDSATAAGAINNIWLTICDIRSAIKNIQVNCCGNSCDDVQIAMTATIQDPNLVIYFTGTVPNTFVECGVSSQQLTITDCDGGLKILNIPVLSTLNDTSGYTIPLSSISPPINSACNLDLSLLACFRDPDSGTECQRVVEYVVYNSVDCPELILTGGFTTVDYAVNYLGIGSIDVVVEIYDPIDNSLVSSDGYVGLVGPFNQLGQFTGLIEGKTYRVRTVLTVGGNTTICPWSNVTTLATPCGPGPINVTSQLDIP